MAYRGSLGLVSTSLLFLVLASGESSVSSEKEYNSPPKVLSSELYPCSQCHASIQAVDIDRVIDFHIEKTLSGHGEPLRDCFDCHDSSNLDNLRLVNGEAVKFEELDTLCGQCHGKIYNAWQAGAYGKRTGNWNGAKRYYRCSECHDPHRPVFTPMEPEPAPTKPGQTLR